MDVIVAVVGVIDAGVTTAGTGEALCVAIFMVVPGFKSVKGLMGFLHQV